MGYRVRSEGGEVKFQSLYEVQRAIANGLVSPEDELTEDGQDAWRKINTILALQDARPPPSGFFKTDTGRWIIPLCVLLAVCLALVFSEKYRIAGLGLAVFVALLFGQFTFRVFTKRRVR
ncbi:MAG TPA: hypothetical protein VND93_00815 [Myxococcales bacterium]|jgi:hypothetical protein|nr:hypothetical protein [Myxococcales bacterium]